MKMLGATREDAYLVQKWRDDARETLRTCGFPDYDDVSFLQNKNHRYFSFYDDGTLVAFGGLTYIQLENRIAEISLIVDPDLRKDGLGSDCVDMLLDEAFNKMNLKTVCGECYKCNVATDFWYRVCEKYKGYKTTLKNRKFWNGKYYDSFYFSADAEDYRAIQ